MHSAAIERQHLVAIARRDDLLIGAARARQAQTAFGGGGRRTNPWDEIQRRLGAALVALGTRVQGPASEAGVRSPSLATARQRTA
jgi:hypothetical protein